MEKPQNWIDWMNYIETGNLYPAFQPVVSIESGLVYGYEVLGRIEHTRNIAGKEKKVESSLGNFFLTYPNKSYSSESFLRLKKSVDEEIRRLAIEKFAREAEPQASLFLNISPSSIFSYMEIINKDLPLTIQLTRKHGINPKRIIVEITEERIDGNIEVLKPIIDIYRSEGFRIAVDDVGSESSNLDRIGLFHPDIIKVDLQMIRRSVFSRNFKEILFTLSKLGESLGSSLLFEGIEKEDELYNALNYGSRFLQGYYFSEAKREFIDSTNFKQDLNLSLDKYYRKKTNEILKLNAWESKIQKSLSTLDLKFLSLENQDLIKEHLINSNISFFRLYITDSKGIQVSPNYVKIDDVVSEISEYKGKNWSWRPYFFEHKYKSSQNQIDWVISSVYHDISENTFLKTFSKNLEGGFILFIDVIFD
ncbi:MAG: EAL domain-containing protein [Leptospiraceae bacterium]|nr:EAL domain-containing protein [Leptospiraceae bacterium]